MFTYFSKNGTLLPIHDAVIPLNNIEYSYGFGIYESIKVRNNVAYFQKQHIQRLFRSAEVINLSHPFSKEDVHTFLSDLIEKVKADAYNVKILLIGGRTQNDAQLFILPLSPLFPERKFYREGIKTLTVPYERPFPNAKTLNMLGSYLAFRKARENSCYDALLLKNQNIIEGTRTNFFAIKGRTIVTQPDEQILQGVTRETVLHVAKKEGFEIETGDISLNTIGAFDGAFLTSTSSNILPIRQIDDFVFPEISENIKRLMESYEEFLKKSNGIFNP